MLRDSSETNQRPLPSFSPSRPRTKLGPYFAGCLFGASRNAVLANKRLDLGGDGFVRREDRSGSITTTGAA